VSPNPPEVGLIEEIDGGDAESTVNVAADEPVPFDPVTMILPVTAPGGTVMVSFVSLLITKGAFGGGPPGPGCGPLLSPMTTLVVPVKPDPVMTTESPGFPLPGVNDVTTGGPSTVNGPSDEVPRSFVTVMEPVVAPYGTQVWMLVSPFTKNSVAEVPLNFTDVVPVKPEPVNVTDVLGPPDDGVNPVRFGAWLAEMMSDAADWPVPPHVYT